MENFNREEVKEEVLKVGKWKRFFFMTVYAFAIQFALNIALVIAFIQFLFFLFTSKRIKEGNGSSAECTSCIRLQTWS